LKDRKKTRFRKVYLYWLLIDLAVAVIIAALLLYRPFGYQPADVAYDGQVSQYLTHELLPQLYNGAQRQEPFEVVVVQKGINDAIARSQWPRQSDGISFSIPKVLFETDRIVLMTTSVVSGMEFFVTIVAEPKLDQQGLLNLHVAKVKVGAMNITLLARAVARRMYARRLSATYIDPQDMRARIAASLLNDEPFEPVFEIDHKKVRVEKIIIAPEKLTIYLVGVLEYAK